ncbi:uncharacterized protein LOC108734197 [Agrilus planipennis]|uniref:Uncharacterized protein LOC108734197 n=1 Tax=Agrilus planipennis TaxID=224129 RepID=A0A7F5REL7_AGRPL|nr:uncharacterized protein LOC108734197 [Agrilus planipennis]
MKRFLFLFFLNGFAFGNEIIQNILNVNSNNTFSGHPFLEAITSIYFDHRLERVKEICVENGGENAFEELEKNTEDLKKCLEAIPLPAEMELPSKVCPEKILKLRSCFDEAKNKINVCERKEEKFLTDYLADSITAMLHYGCHELVPLLNELTKCMEGLDCLAYFIQERNRSVKENMFSCMKEAQHKEIPEPYFSKERYCKRVTDSKDCALDLVEKWCKGNKLTKDFIVGLAGAAKAPCKKE